MKRKKSKKIKSNSMMVDKFSYSSGMAALNGHIENLQEEYERLFHEGMQSAHPIMKSLLYQVKLMHNIHACFESSIIYGDAGEDQVTRSVQ